MPCQVTPPWALVAQYAVASTIPPLSARSYAYWHKGAQTPEVEEEEELFKADRRIWKKVKEKAEDGGEEKKEEEEEEDDEGRCIYKERERERERERDTDTCRHTEV